MTSQGVGLPRDPALPLLVYGAFRPGELAHRLLDGQLQSPPLSAVVEGAELRLRDGLPLLVTPARGSVRGDVLHLDTPGYEVVADYEPKHLYRWVELDARVGDALVRVNALRGYRPHRGVDPEPVFEWAGHQDPLFGHGMAALGEQALSAVRRAHISAPQEPELWASFIRLQGLYLTAWTLAERVSALAFGPEMDPMVRVKRLDGWKASTQAIQGAHPPPVRVFDSRDPETLKCSEKHGFFTTWYASRSNLSHRGKAAMTDAELVRASLIGLHDTLRVLLGNQIPGLAQVWRDDQSARRQQLEEPWLLRIALQER